MESSLSPRLRFLQEARESEAAVELALAAVRGLLDEEGEAAISERDIYEPRFGALHRIVTQVIEQTGFASGLYSETCLCSAAAAAAADDDPGDAAGAGFLNKIALCVATCSGSAVVCDDPGVTLLSGSRAAPLLTARLLSGLAAAASDQTIDRPEAVRRTLAAFQRTGGVVLASSTLNASIPKLPGQAMLVLELLAARNLVRPTATTSTPTGAAAAVGRGGGRASVSGMAARALGRGLFPHRLAPFVEVRKDH